MCYIVVDGMVEEVDWSIGDLQEYVEAGGALYATPAGPVADGVVQATVFDRPVRAVPLFDGPAYFNEGRRVQVGVASEYRIIATPGLSMHPPISSAQLCDLAYAASRELFTSKGSARNCFDFGVSKF